MTCPAEHDFYLRTLVAISEVAQDPDSDLRWLRARNVEALREIVLGSRR
jgi:hypothetical protein